MPWPLWLALALAGSVALALLVGAVIRAGSREMPHPTGGDARGPGR